MRWNILKQKAPLYVKTLSWHPYGSDYEDECKHLCYKD